MITVLIFNVIVVLFAYLAHKQRSVLFLKISFFLIFLFFALRYDYGNDYMAYYYGFKDIRYYDPDAHFEIGWQYLNLLFKPLGFFAMVAFLAAIQCVVYYRFIKNYVPQKYYWLALFLFLFNPTCMLINSSAMRQSLALIIFIYSIKYIFSKDAIRYFICIIVASTFHSSALILLPVYFIRFFGSRVNKPAAVIIFFLYPFMYLILNYLKAHVSNFVEVYFHNYQIYLDKEMSNMGTGLGFLFGIFLFALIINKAFLQIGKDSLLYKIAILSYFIMPFAFINTMVNRIGMYFEPFIIVAFIGVLSLFKDYNIRYAVVGLYAIITLMSFYGFFHSNVWASAFSEYKTILSAPSIY